MTTIKCQKCFHVNTYSAKVGRRDSCEKCAADFHACLYCRFYDRSCYNECQENKADRVLDKERSNYCDFFELNPKLANLAAAGATPPTSLSARDLAEALFKKN